MRYIVAFLVLIGTTVPSYSQHRHGHHVPHYRHYHQPRVMPGPPAYYPPPRAYYPPPRAYYAPPVYVAPRQNRWRERAATAAIIAIFGTAAAYYAYCNNNPNDDYCY